MAHHPKPDPTWRLEIVPIRDDVNMSTQKPSGLVDAVTGYCRTSGSIRVHSNDNLLRRQVKAGISRRSDFPLRRESTALLVIDIQRYLSDSAADHAYFHQTAFPRMIQNANLLMRCFRKVRDNNDPESVSSLQTSNGGEVIFTYLQAATTDGRDISLDYKLSGPLLAKIPRFGTPFDELFCDECRPAARPSHWKG